MVKKLTKTNPNLIELIGNLIKKSYEEDVAIWRDVGKRLEKATRKQVELNLSDINRFAKDGETVLIPGKVLSNGNLDKKVTVVALNFSKRAQEKIESTGGECFSINDILEKNPKGSNIRIMG